VTREALTSLLPVGQNIRRVRILVVDDDRAVREGLDRVLRRDGFEVVLAGDGESARLALAGGSLDAVVLDLLLPDSDGVEICRSLRRAGDRTPVLMLTARDAVADRVAGWGPVPTTTWSSRLRSRSCARACARCCGAPVAPTWTACCVAPMSSLTRWRLRRAAVTVRSRSRGPSSVCSSCSCVTRVRC
jgi:CheY-like chemotaxis protein